MNNDLYEFSCPMSEKEKLGVPFINPESPYVPVDERETLTINFDDNDDQVFGSDIKANLKPFFVNLMCKIHNTQFIEDKTLRETTEHFKLRKGRAIRYKEQAKKILKRELSKHWL